MEHAWRQWEPQMIYVQHQSSPFPTRIWLPPFAEPIATHAPFLMSREVNTIGMAIAQGLEERGQVGATHMGTGYDAWYAGLHRLHADVQEHRVVLDRDGACRDWRTRASTRSKRFPQEYKDLRPQALYTSPWAAGEVDAARRGRLHGDRVALGARLRRALQGERAAQSLSIGQVADRDSIARKGRSRTSSRRSNATRRPRSSCCDGSRLAAFASSQLTAPMTVEGETFPAGTWVIPTDQEFIALAREVLDPQVYPDLREFDGGPPEQPYDAAGWTLPMTMGVRVVTATKPMTAADRAKYEDARRRHAA